ncbi:MAG: hypothetical protein JWP41_1769 [Ramlibacter sp.]|jgi:hypothetical protein|nr:hypothetical protein [Ramlibacter sp.]
MARFVHIEYSTNHGGVTRFSRGFTAVGNWNASQLALGALAFIGSPLTRTAARIRTGLQGWSARRELRRQDEKLWNIALNDARVMADLSRAMSREAGRDVHAFV